MKTLTALFAAAALTLTAGLAQADDLSPSQISQLVKEGKIKSMEELKQVVEKLHPGATIGLPDVEESRTGYEYEVEVRYPDGREFDIELNAATGEVSQNRPDH
ncbi:MULTISPECIES: PepSY domain-containing protein [Pseudomonas]|uniref:PepSY domain-containing protein n=1 Tax=Pseudomonas TaxID=286 RepID=UPI00069D64EA|nr:MULTISPECIES: PepSY domain-containing protein [Pseudomonas]MCE0461839.1 PepSY domain-containing protein [Pseudomonas uvaldensis]